MEIICKLNMAIGNFGGYVVAVLLISSFCNFMYVSDWHASLVVTCGEFLECSWPENSASSSQCNKTGSSSSEIADQGPTIIYVPTRKQTVELANYLCKTGLKAAAYNAKVNLLWLICVANDTWSVGPISWYMLIL